MQGERKKAPLAPLSLHPAEIEESVALPLSYHKKVIARFGFVQALVAVVIYLGMVLFTYLPLVENAKKAIDNALVNANFSRVVIKNNELNIDIKPAIWTFLLSSTEKSQYFVVVDTTGKLNKYFWDDIVHEGKKISRYGLQFDKQGIRVHLNTGVKQVRYQQIGLKEGVSYDKQGLYTHFNSFLSPQLITVYVIVGAILVFILAYLLGIAAHFLFGLVIGYLVSMLQSRLCEEPQRCIKMCWSLYIPYFLVMAATSLIIYLCTKTMPILLVVMLLQILLLPILIFYAFLQAKMLSQKQTKEKENSGNSKETKK